MRFGDEHVADQTTFDCVKGDGPWPCAAARGQLHDLSRVWPRTVGIYLDSQREKAHRQLVPGDLKARFVGWLLPTGSAA